MQLRRDRSNPAIPLLFKISPARRGTQKLLHGKLHSQRLSPTAQTALFLEAQSLIGSCTLSNPSSLGNRLTIFGLFESRETKERTSVRPARAFS